MARDAIHITTLAANSATASPTDGTVTQANGSKLVPVKSARKYVLRVTHTASGSHDVTVLKGSSPPADAAGQGDLVTTFAAGNVTAVVKWIGPLSSARFQQSDGTISVDYASGFTGTVEAFILGAGA